MKMKRKNSRGSKTAAVHEHGNRKGCDVTSAALLCTVRKNADSSNRQAEASSLRKQAETIGSDRGASWQAISFICVGGPRPELSDGRGVREDSTHGGQRAGWWSRNPASMPQAVRERLVPRIVEARSEPQKLCKRCQLGRRSRKSRRALELLRFASNKHKLPEEGASCKALAEERERRAGLEDNGISGRPWVFADHWCEEEQLKESHLKYSQQV